MTYFNTASAAGTGATQTLTITEPASMVRGQIAIMFAMSDSTGAQARTISVTGGQSWTQIYNINQNNAGQTIWWCIFNGTWTASPVIDFTAATPTVTSQLIQIQVFTPTHYINTWHFESLSTSVTLGSTTCTIAGVSFINQSVLALASWGTSDQNTWGNLTAGWSVAGAADYGATGSGLSATYALKIFTASGSTGNVSKDQLTAGPDNCIQHMIIFAEIYKSQILN